MSWLAAILLAASAGAGPAPQTASPDGGPPRDPDAEVIENLELLEGLEMIDQLDLLEPEREGRGSSPEKPPPADGGPSR